MNELIKQINDNIVNPKQYQIFFGLDNDTQYGQVSQYFFENNIKNTWIGDLDFHIGNDELNITCEVKHIHDPKKPIKIPLSFMQAREYSCDVNSRDHLDRKRKRYLIEVHNYASKPYVVIVPFKQWQNDFKTTMDCLDMENARCLYIENQLPKFFLTGDNTIGTYVTKDLLCIN